MAASLQSTHAPAASFSFSDTAAFPQAGIINDNVMGGVSVSSIQKEGDFNRFSGRVSLDYNGGFASVRFLIAEPLPNLNKISLRVKGDGLAYQLRFSMGGAWQTIGYSVNFQTMKDTWQTFEFQISDFKPVWRGRTVSNAPLLELDRARQVALFIADKQEGEFSILLDSITLSGTK